MIGIDTNVLARFVLHDDAVQSPQAERFIRRLTPEKPGWISIGVLLELVWVVRNKGAGRAELVSMIEMLCTERCFRIDEIKTVVQALDRYRSGKTDFSNCLIAASAAAAGCTKTVTFDAAAARDAGMELLG